MRYGLVLDLSLRIAAGVALLGGIAGVPSGAQAQMALSGVAGVSNVGAANYVVPLSLPPGVNGLEPKLSLSYDSRRDGDGPLGIGWQIDGLSKITRCPRTLAVDGVVGGVNYDLNDRYCLDGQPLKLVSGTYGASGSEYRTEIDYYSRIKGIGSVASSGVAAFEVTTKSGLRLYYGYNFDPDLSDLAEGRIYASGINAVREYALNRVYDVNNNYIRYIYTGSASTGEYNILYIDYTWTDNGDNPDGTMQARVHFEYTDRNSGYFLTKYQAGARMNSTKNLSNIYIKNRSGEISKKYVIGYEVSTNSYRYRPRFIRECSETNCMPQTDFEWSEFPLTADDQKYLGGNPVWSAILGGANGWVAEGLTRQRNLVDVNGDGRADVLGFAYSGAPVHLSKSEAPEFDYNGYWTAAFGDGPSSGNWDNDNVTPRRVIDMNNDGLPDIIGFRANDVRVALNSGGAFGYGAAWLVGHFGSSNLIGTGPEKWDNEALYPRHVLDLNGDGYADILGFGSNGVYVSYSKGVTSDAEKFTDPVRKVAAFGTRNYSGPYEAALSGLSSAGASVSAAKVVSPGSVAAFAEGDEGSGSGDTSSEGSGDSGAGGSGDGNNSGNDGSGAGDYSSGGGENQTTNGPGDGNNSGEQGNGDNGGVTQTVGGYPFWANTEEYPRFLADVNGDRRPDIVGFGKAGVQVSLNTGVGFTAPTEWIAGYGIKAGYLTQSKHPRFVQDVNGDGLADIVAINNSGTVRVLLSTGEAFIDDGNWDSGFGVTNGYDSMNSHPRHLADMNGDGRPDLVGFSDGGVDVALNRGNAFIGQTAKWRAYFGATTGGTWNDDSKRPRAVADVNGDGLADIIGFHDTNTFVSLNNPGRLFKPDLLVKVTDGLGMETQFAYLPLSHVTAPYTKAAAALEDAQRNRPALNVVTSLKTGNGIGGLAERTYAYHGGQWNTQGRDFLGFERVTVFDKSNLVETRIDFHQTFPYIGFEEAVTRTLVYGADRHLLSTLANTYAYIRPEPQSYGPRLTKTVEVQRVWQTLESITRPITTTTTTYAYDALSNPSVIHVVKEDEATRDATVVRNYITTTTNTYLNDPNHRVLNQLIKQVVRTTVPDEH